MDLEAPYHAKIQMFLWKCYNNSVPVKSTLVNRGFQGDTTCEFCPNGNETVNTYP